ncbi:uncharacterized protein RSE6_01705 [Rhynchosporium secalis]|uniref:Uncharacterized protein n=1 Tax=Rhynchosporium secalis TaxID=38038 RepID=A0A1E1LYH0_RHYSE|nr:uncharacterized protein RSE6_01705 [Rhynchosporium secalis]
MNETHDHGSSVLSSKRIWSNPATDTFYLSRHSFFVLSSMNHAGYSFHNFRRIKTIGVDEFDIRTLGLLHLFLNRFKGATAIVPIGADSAHQSMQGAMTAYQRSEHFWMRF